MMLCLTAVTFCFSVCTDQFDIVQENGQVPDLIESVPPPTQNWFPVYISEHFRTLVQRGVIQLYLTNTGDYTIFIGDPADLPASWTLVPSVGDWNIVYRCPSGIMNSPPDPDTP